jgi:hypothetical protein
VTDWVELEEALLDDAVLAAPEQYVALVTEFNTKLEDMKTKHNFKFVDQIMTARLADSMDENGIGGLDIEL